jgi:hypothetical protein
MRRWVQSSGKTGADCDDANCTHWDENGAVAEYGHFLWLIKPVDPDMFEDVNFEKAWQDLQSSPRGRLNYDLGASPDNSDPFALPANRASATDPFAPAQSPHE